MNEQNTDPETVALRGLLREARGAPDLPSRFQEGTWRRIEGAELKALPEPAGWMNTWFARFLRPKFAFAGVALLIVTGAALGIRDGAHVAREDAQARYMAAVAPDLLR
jgi:hypothetical protein